MSCSKGSPQPRDLTCVSCISCTGRQVLFCGATGEALAYIKQKQYAYTHTHIYKHTHIIHTHIFTKTYPYTNIYMYLHVSVARYTYISMFFNFVHLNNLGTMTSPKAKRIPNTCIVVSKYQLEIKRSGTGNVLENSEISLPYHKVRTSSNTSIVMSKGFRCQFKDSPLGQR